MAGRRQHYLPRFLQRPFRYRATAENDYVYVHESSRSYAPSTMGVGQERDFYGSAEESPADDNITLSETRLAKTLNWLNSDPSAVSQEDQATLVAALVVRTRQMRESMSGMIQTTSVEMASAIEQQGLLKRELQTFWTDGQKLDRLIAEQLANVATIPDELRGPMAMQLKQAWYANQAALSAQMEEMGQQLANEFFSRMEREAAQIADNSFRRVFEGDPTVPARVASLVERYAFAAIEADPGEKFILGDCAAIAFRSDKAPRIPLGDVNDQIPLDFIYLPISPTRCVAAMKRGATPWASTADINRASASLSHRFFISQSPEPAGLGELKALIGTAEPLATNEDIQMMLEGIGDPPEA